MASRKQDRFADKFGDLASTFPGSNVVFLLQKKRLYFDRHVLSYHSDVFKKMFQGDFAEKNKEEINLQDELFEEFQLFLQLLKPGLHTPSVSSEHVGFLLKLSDKYEVPHVLKVCLDFMKLSWSDGDQIWDGLRLSCKYMVKDTTHHFLKLASTRPLTEVDKFRQDNKLECFTDAVCCVFYRIQLSNTSHKTINYHNPNYDNYQKYLNYQKHSNQYSDTSYLNNIDFQNPKYPHYNIKLLNNDEHHSDRRLTDAGIAMMFEELVNKVCRY